MVTEVAGQSLPVLSENVWWRLRGQFKKSIPSSVTPSYLGAFLGQKDSSARLIVRSLRLLGLIDDEGHPTDLANEWRDEDAYSHACLTMLEKTYPAELIDLAGPPNPDREVVKTWLMRTRRMGEGAAGNVAATYALIANGDSARQRERPGSATPSTVGSTAGSTGKPERASRARGSVKQAPREKPIEFDPPRVQVAVQINIDPSMSPEQIEQVFKSMAEHFYGHGA